MTHSKFKQNRLANMQVLGTQNRGCCNNQPNGCCCNNQPNEGCCRGSHLRGEGIKPISPGLYFADADLECSTIFCFGRDSDTKYEWDLRRISGNATIVGDRIKIGNDRVMVSGTGEFELIVRVTFTCRSALGNASCVRERSRVFTQ